MFRKISYFYRKNRIKYINEITLISCALIASFICISIWILTPDETQLIEFFSSNIRASLFGGFLTVGGFLFSLKTFIIIKMKEEVYDHQAYIKRYNEQKKFDDILKQYGPLQRLSHLLFASVLSSIITAVTQFSIGLIANKLAVIICIWTASFSLCLLIISLILIKRNLDEWFNFLEEIK